MCNGHNGTSHMTPPKEFYEAVTDSLQYLDTKLPSGSTVLIVALVDGRILWNIMHSKGSLLPHLDASLTLCPPSQTALIHWAFPMRVGASS